MARIYSLARKSTLALRQRRGFLLKLLRVPPDAVRASYVERFSVCGKKQCHCHHGGSKHGPFYYLAQSLGPGKVNKFLLKSDQQRAAARKAIDHFREFQDHLEELSQINTELLKREDFPAQA